MNNKRYTIQDWTELKDIPHDKTYDTMNNIVRDLDEFVCKIRSIKIDDNLKTPKEISDNYNLQYNSILHDVLKKIEKDYNAKILNLKTAHKSGYIHGYIKINDLEYQFKITGLIQGVVNYEDTNVES